MKTVSDTFPEIYNAKLALDSLSIYRNLLNDRILNRFYRLTDYICNGTVNLNLSVKLYNEFFYELTNSVDPDKSLYTFKNYILDKLLFDDNLFSRSSELFKFDDISDQIKASARADLHYLQILSGFSSKSLKHCLLSCSSLSDFEKNVISNLPDFNTKSNKLNSSGNNQFTVEITQLFYEDNSWPDLLKELAKFHYENGSSEFARYYAFTWEQNNGRGYLKGIKHPDPINLSDLIGYDEERSIVIENTEQFLKGFSANNVLLYGDRGTGKSSTVKAILNKYAAKGLRMIEVPKSRLIDFPEIVRSLLNRNQKFIIFVDDLAFEDNEENYTALKAILEGSLEVKPSNVLIYATSNRRHIIKEKFSDRSGFQSLNADDEVRAADSIQEKLSLSDRFGITVVFSSPDKYKFLEIVEGIAEKRALGIDKESLHREALKWVMWYNGRSPRSARQFIDWLEGQTKR